jgi:hypothetical protein
VEKEKQEHLSGVHNMAVLVAACNDVGRNGDESNLVTSFDRKHDYVHQNMMVQDICHVIMTGLETCFKLGGRGTEGAAFTESVSFTS